MPDRWDCRGYSLFMKVGDEYVSVENIPEIESYTYTDTDGDDYNIDIHNFDHDMELTIGLQLNNEQKVMLRKEMKLLKATANRISRWIRRDKRKKKEAKKKARKEKFRNVSEGGD